jgi:hypothetical protein
MQNETDEYIFSKGYFRLTKVSNTYLSFWCIFIILQLSVLLIFSHMTIAMLRKCYGQRHVNVLNEIKVAVRYWDSERQNILNFQWDRHCTFKTIHEGTVKVQTSTEVCACKYILWCVKIKEKFTNYR